VANSVFIVGNDSQVKSMFLKLGWKIAESLPQADLVQFTGGADVSPFLYGQGRHEKTTNINPQRDERETVMFGVALSKKKPMAGICRGAQFLNVMCGGSIWQHCNGHVLAGTHSVIDNVTAEIYQGTSTHHQLMNPSRDGFIVAVAYEARERHRCDGLGNTYVVDPSRQGDPEVVYYENQNCLCFQPHPENVNGGELAEIYKSYIETYCFDGGH
jgi:anthranilate/para-aminobenzoate synthase component II